MSKKARLPVDAKRDAVLKLLRNAESAADLAEKCGVKKETLFRWQDRFLEGGTAALAASGGGRTEPDTWVRRLKLLKALLDHRVVTTDMLAKALGVDRTKTLEPDLARVQELTGGFTSIVPKDSEPQPNQLDGDLVITRALAGPGTSTAIRLGVDENVSGKWRVARHIATRGYFQNGDTVLIGPGGTAALLATELTRNTHPAVLHIMITEFALRPLFPPTYHLYSLGGEFLPQSVAIEMDSNYCAYPAKPRVSVVGIEQLSDNGCSCNTSERPLLDWVAKNTWGRVIIATNHTKVQDVPVPNPMLTFNTLDDSEPEYVIITDDGKNKGVRRRLENIQQCLLPLQLVIVCGWCGLPKVLHQSPRDEQVGGRSEEYCRDCPGSS